MSHYRIVDDWTRRGSITFIFLQRRSVRGRSGWRRRARRASPLWKASATTGPFIFNDAPRQFDGILGGLPEGAFTYYMRGSFSAEKTMELLRDAAWTTASSKVKSKQMSPWSIELSIKKQSVKKNQTNDKKWKKCGTTVVHARICIYIFKNWKKKVGDKVKIYIHIFIKNLAEWLIQLAKEIITFLLTNWR